MHYPTYENDSKFDHYHALYLTIQIEIARLSYEMDAF